MKICIQQFLNSPHSWAIVGQNIARSLITKGHGVDLHSTNGYEHFPKDLKPFVKEKLGTDYDMQLSYTFVKNFQTYLSHGIRNRFGIWSIEFDDYFPQGFAKYASHADKILVPSNHTKGIFANAGIKEESLVVVPHGVDESFYTGTSIYLLPEKYKDKVKILVNIAQPHLRKGIAGLLDVYGRAFTKKDNVVLIFKVKAQKPSMPWDVDINGALASFKKKYVDHADLFHINHFIEDISSLYRACDIYFFPSKAEAFSLSPAEAIASGLITITSRHGGALDFCSDSNSLLIDGVLEKADPKMLYWLENTSSGASAKCFAPNLDQAVDILRHAVENNQRLKEFFNGQSQILKEKYTWDKVADQIMGLAQ